MPVSDQGSLDGRYALVPRTLVFLTCGGQVLLLKGAPHKRLWANLYNGIGGHIERGEDVLGAACRELFEETGLSPTGLWLCGVITIDTGKDIGIAIFIVRGECSARELPRPLPSAEGSLEWVPQENAYQLPLVEDLTTLLPRVLSMQPGEAPFSAHYSYDQDGRLHISFREA